MRNFRNTILFSAVILSVIAIMFFFRMPDRVIQNKKLVIKGKFGIIKNMDELVIIDTLNQIPEIKLVHE